MLATHTRGERYADVGICATSGVPIRLCYQTFTVDAAPKGVVLLIMGLASPSLLWNTGFCCRLASHGYCVIRFDNRDVGKSTFLTGHQIICTASASPSSTPFITLDHQSDETDAELWGKLQTASSRGSSRHKTAISSAMYLRLAYASLIPGGQRLFREAYTLEDMAKDCVGLLDALGVKKAHLVGMSMGGMIAQVVATRFPSRVESLSLISTHASSPKTIWPSKRLMFYMARTAQQMAQKGFTIPLANRLSKLATSPSPDDEEELAQIFASLFARVAFGTGSVYPIQNETLHRQARRIVQWSSDFSGVARQYVAMVKASNRIPQLAKVCVPCVVLHGTVDPLVPFANGVELADNIPGARLVAIEGLGHVLHPTVWDRIVGALVENMSKCHTSGAKSAALKAKI
ncbi:putative alpha beta hydrolase fold Alpha beta hydrolase family Serine aminopeptidase S33 [Trypanosoma vivax]|nr:putative hydrolase, alpha/beta fold family [Trypanosoma vivax]KAH8620522.1 putative alpha beta hydrolase fold Alpha beta hydrolase family Serine aminopeptidase S33 [Trypanosoma vivax]